MIDNNIPKHWQGKKLGEVCQIYQGYGFPKVLQGSINGKYPFYKVGDISKNVKAGHRHLHLCDNFIDEEVLLKIKAKPYPKNTIVFAKIGEGLKLNRRAIINIPGIVDNNAIGLKAIESICNDLFLFYFLTTVRLEDYSKATTVPSVRKSEIEDIPFVLPPLTEQLAIVSKIEELLSDLDNGKQQLLTAQQQLKVYRQSLLKAAFEGKLTNKNLKEGELPKGWKMTTIGSIFEVFIGSTPKRNNPDYWGGSINWLSSGEIAFCNIKSTKEKISLEGLQNTSCKVHPIGTVIMAMIGEGKTRGQAAILNIEASHNQNTAAIRVDNNIYKSSLLYYYLVFKYEDNRRVGSGNNQKALNKERIKSIQIPLPLFAEQQLIVDELESKLTVCDKIEETIKEALLKSETLRQSILKKAFEGSLI